MVPLLSHRAAQSKKTLKYVTFMMFIVWNRKDTNVERHAYIQTTFRRKSTEREDLADLEIFFKKREINFPFLFLTFSIREI